MENIIKYQYFDFVLPTDNSGAFLKIKDENFIKNLHNNSKITDELIYFPTKTNGILSIKESLLLTPEYYDLFEKIISNVHKKFVVNIDINHNVINMAVGINYNKKRNEYNIMPATIIFFIPRL